MENHIENYMENHVENQLDKPIGRLYGKTYGNWKNTLAIDGWPMLSNTHDMSELVEAAHYKQHICIQRVVKEVEQGEDARHSHNKEFKKFFFCFDVYSAHLLS